MSDSGVFAIMERIKVATPSSPIAVFDIGSHEKLNAVFAGTVATQKRIAAKDHQLIGVYDNTMTEAIVRDELNIALMSGATHRAKARTK